MTCFWKCGVAKTDVIENPIQELVEDNLSVTEIENVSDKTINPNKDYQEDEYPDLVLPNSVVGLPEPLVTGLPEPLVMGSLEDIKDKNCTWYGTISAAYNNEREYYTLNSEDSIIYFGRFPYEWAMNHKPLTGPSECEQCFKNGMYHDVFLGYCMSCAIDSYGGLRGRGFVSPGIENHYDSRIQSVFDTYLKDVDLDLVGKDYIWYGFNVELDYARDYDDSELCIHD